MSTFQLNFAKEVYLKNFSQIREVSFKGNVYDFSVDYDATDTSTVLINSHNKKVRYKMVCYIFHDFLLVIILLFTIAIICYHYTKHGSKWKSIGTLSI